MKKLVILGSACGVGKSTIIDELNKENILDNYICIDCDEVLNWLEYKGTDKEDKFYEDVIAEAVRMANDKNLFFVSCMNPYDFYGKLNIPQEITATFLIGMTCSDEEITRRLKSRPQDRMCGSNEFIAGQIEYNNWFKKNSGKFQLYIDNTDMTVGETVKKISKFIKSIEI